MTVVHVSSHFDGYAHAATESRDNAFNSLVSTRRGALIGFAYGLTGNRAEAEELAADAIARCWVALRRRPIDQLELYVRRTIVNLTIQQARRRKVDQRHQPCRRDDWRLKNESEEHFDRFVFEHDDLRDALRQLRPEYRAAVVARFLFDHSEDETALILSIPVGTVKSRCARALAALRASLMSVAEVVEAVDVA